MTTQRTAGSKPSAGRRDKAALKAWARRQLAVAKGATAQAVQEHLAAGRPVVFEKDGRLYVKTSAREKARPLDESNTAEQLRQISGIAEERSATYTTKSAKQRRRAKHR